MLGRRGRRSRGRRWVGDAYRRLRNQRLQRILIAAAGLVLAGGTLVFVAELSAADGQFGGLLDSLWWAVVTLTTVGYGDRVPITPTGRALATVFMLTGVVVTSLLSGTIASIFVDRKIREGKGLGDVVAKGHLVICGWNRRAESIVDAVIAMEDADVDIVLINEMDPEAFQELDVRLASASLRFVRGDFTHERVLRRGSLSDCRSAIILSDESGDNTLSNADERTILAALAMSSLHDRLRVSAELINSENEQHLRRAHVDDILVYGEFNGFLHATATRSGGIPLLVRELLRHGGDYGVQQVPVPAAFVGRSFIEMSSHYTTSGNGTVIGLLAQDKQMSLGDILSEGSEAIDDFIKRKFEEGQIELENKDGPGHALVLNPAADYILRDTDAAFIIGAA